MGSLTIHIFTMPSAKTPIKNPRLLGEGFKRVSLITAGNDERGKTFSYATIATLAATMSPKSASPVNVPTSNTSAA